MNKTMKPQMKPATLDDRECHYGRLSVLRSKTGFYVGKILTFHREKRTQAVSMSKTYKTMEEAQNYLKGIRLP